MTGWFVLDFVLQLDVGLEKSQAPSRCLHSDKSTDFFDNKYLHRRSDRHLALQMVAVQAEAKAPLDTSMAVSICMLEQLIDLNLFENPSGSLLRLVA